MKNKLYYVLFLLYAIVVAFVLYANGVFTGEEANMTNLLINVGFLVIIGILFMISAVSFGRLNRCTDELESLAERLPEESKKAGKNPFWENYQESGDLFADEELNYAFNEYRLRMRSYKTKRGYISSCDIDEFINEDLLDQIGMNYYNSTIAGTMTGLGILGTFLGLSMGLGTFNGDDIYTISDNVGPLLAGMKVAFHTSVYGIFFSLVFNFIHRGIMADAYEKLENFQNVFRQYAAPVTATEDENSAAMVIYQASMANALKQTVELLKGNALEQTGAVERMVEQFAEQMTASLGVQFQKLGNTLKAAAEAQTAAAASSRELIEAATALVEVNRSTQAALNAMLERQEAFAGELKEQKEQLARACDEMSSEVSNQLYAFDQLRSYSEK